MALCLSNFDSSVPENFHKGFSSFFGWDSDSDSDFDIDIDSDSGDEGFGLVELFGNENETPYMEIELPPSGKSRPHIASSWSDDDGDDGSLGTVPVEKTDGFGQGGLFRMDVGERRCFDYDMFSQLAVEEYNRRFKGELQYVKILAALSHFCNFVVVYLTFEAKDLADGGTIKIYQAVVWWTVGDIDKVVLSFRLKPPEDEQEGSENHGNEWFWKGHH